MEYTEECKQDRRQTILRYLKPSFRKEKYRHYYDNPVRNGVKKSKTKVNQTSNYVNFGFGTGLTLTPAYCTIVFIETVPHKMGLDFKVSGFI